MAYLLRLIAYAFVFFCFSPSVHAVPATVTYCDMASGCKTKEDWVEAHRAAMPENVCWNNEKFPMNWWATENSSGGIDIWRQPSAACQGYAQAPPTYVISYARGAVSCPANSAASNGVCACNAGYVEQNGVCSGKKSDVCGSLQGMSLGITSMESDFGPQSSQWAASKLGKSGNACMSGCQTSGTVTSCVAGTGKSSSTVCYLSSPSFTGEACSDPTTGGSGGEGTEGGKDKPQDCPVGYEASKYAPGVCIPKPNDCPSGSSPSKYVEGVCIPNEKGDDGSCEDPKDPTKRAECEGKGNQCPSGQVQSTTQVNTCVPAKDGTDKDKNGSNINCKDGKCTVTKQDGTKEEKGQDEVCKEQPDLAMCKETKGQFSGSCTSSFRCDGDVLQCAALQEQHQRNCQLFDTPNDTSRLFDMEAKRPQEDVLSVNGTEIDLKGHIAVDSVIGNGVCPQDLRVEVFGKPVDFRLSQFCQYFNAMGMLVMLGTAASCLRILGS